MFYILIILGIILIALGTYLERKVNTVSNDVSTNEIYKSEANKTKNLAYKEEVEGLEKRLQAIEEILFNSILEESIDKPMTMTENLVERDALEKYKLIKKYEKQKKSLDEIAKLLDMNKGEVLLLKNLYKDS